MSFLSSLLLGGHWLVGVPHDRKVDVSGDI